MPIAQTVTTTTRRSLRVWPGVLVAALIVVARFVVPLIVSDAPAYGILAALAGSAIIVVWWLFFSRAPWSERLGALVLIGLAVFATKFIVHPSIANGFMGMMVYVYAAPLTVSLAFVAWAVATRRLSDGVRRVTMVVAILLGCGVWTLARSGGVTGDGDVDLHWRWTPTPEQRLLTEARDDVPAPPAAPAAVRVADEHAATPSAPAAAPPAATAEAIVPAAAATSEPEWPGFRGPHRDSIISGTRLDTDWAASPPVQLWRKPIGPGWSSFAVHGDRVYTQEQRGEDELVSCYRLKTGEPVWRHRDRARFYESNGGPGPRATPTLHHGRVYTLGATGIMNVLDEGTGALIWSRNAATDTGAPMPGWGYTGSPLIVGDAVIVSTSGRLVSYDLATGRPRWTHTTGGSGYSSPHFVTIDGVAQILLLTGNGATSVAPADGTRLWQHLWDVGVAIVQPALAGDDILIGLGDAMGGQGLRRVAIARHPSGWTAEERWTTRALKPYFNDFVVHEGHAFGFDGSILACIDLADGTRTWKGGRFGHGQLVLLPDQDLLLVLSEEGELALVSATPDGFTEVARAPAIEGKTWNHPVLAGDILLVRNDQEMAAFRLAVAGR